MAPICKILHQSKLNYMYKTKTSVWNLRCIKFVGFALIGYDLAWMSGQVVLNVAVQTFKFQYNNQFNYCNLTHCR